jgi:stage III sporulation protein AF
VKVLVKTVTEWARDLAVISLTFAFVEMLLPANDLRRFARVVMGIVMIAVIIGFVLDISSALDDALESQAGFTLSHTDTLERMSWSTKGELITCTGLEVVEVEAERKIAAQLESIARLASGADEAQAEIEFTSTGDIRRIYVTLRNLSMPALGTSGDDSGRSGACVSENRKELAGLIEERVINAIQDFYGFSPDVAISVSVDFR